MTNAQSIPRILLIKDNGSGISIGERKTIFSPFSHLDKSALCIPVSTESASSLFNVSPKLVEAPQPLPTLDFRRTQTHQGAVRILRYHFPNLFLGPHNRNLI